MRMVGTGTVGEVAVEQGDSEVGDDGGADGGTRAQPGRQWGWWWWWDRGSSLNPSDIDD